MLPGQKLTGLYGPAAQSTDTSLPGQPVLGGGAGIMPAQGGPLAKACTLHCSGFCLNPVRCRCKSSSLMKGSRKIEYFARMMDRCQFYCKSCTCPYPNAVRSPRHSLLKYEEDASFRRSFVSTNSARAAKQRLAVRSVYSLKG